MKGLKQYIRKHGRHFTNELALAVTEKWNVEQVMSSAQKKVYYNVTSATDGDIVYLVNAFSAFDGLSKGESLNISLNIVGDYIGGKEYAFRYFIATTRFHNPGFDFTPYI